MPDSKITALTALTSADPANDMFPIVDVSDTSMAASGTTKRISINNLLAASGTATLASATISGALDAARLNVTGATIPANGVYLGSANNLSFSAASTLGMTLNSTGLLVGTANNFASSRLCVQGTAGTSTPDVTIGIPVNSSGNTNLAIGRSASTNGYIFLDAYKAGVGGTELVLNSVNGGSVLVGLSTVVPTGGCLQLKSGITFPATPVASSDANTLDDYKESTWSPTITAGSGTPTTVTVNSATYTKIGRVVVAQVDFTIVNKGTATTSLLFTLPFTSASLNQCGAFRETSNTGNMGQIYSNGTTQAGMQFYGNTTVWADANRIAGTFTYFTA